MPEKNRNYLNQRKKEEKNYRCLYIIKPKDRFDMPKLYDAFAELSVKRDIMEHGDEMVLEIQSESPVENLGDILGKFAISYIKAYSIVKDWSTFNGAMATKEEKMMLFARLAQIKPKSRKIRTIPLAVGFMTVAVLVSLYFRTGEEIFIYLAPVMMLLGMAVRSALMSRERKHQDIRDIVNEDWIVCECDVACTNSLFHRTGKSPMKEFDFRLAQGNTCVEHIFSGISLEIGKKVKLFIRGNAYNSPLNESIEYEHGEQIYVFNGSYIVIPDDYKIPASMKLNEKTGMLEEVKVIAERKKKNSKKKKGLFGKKNTSEKKIENKEKEKKKKPKKVLRKKNSGKPVKPEPAEPVSVVVAENATTNAVAAGIAEAVSSEIRKEPEADIPETGNPSGEEKNIHYSFESVEYGCGTIQDEELESVSPKNEHTEEPAPEENTGKTENSQETHASLFGDLEDIEE